MVLQNLIANKQLSFPTFWCGEVFLPLTNGPHLSGFYMQHPSHSDMHLRSFPDNIYLFKVNNRSTRKRCEICSKLTIKAPERRQWLLNVWMLNSTYSTPFSNASIVDLEQVHVSWVISLMAFTCSNAAMKTLEQCVKSLQS